MKRSKKTLLRVIWVLALMLAAVAPSAAQAPGITLRTLSKGNTVLVNIFLDEKNSSTIRQRLHAGFPVRITYEVKLYEKYPRTIRGLFGDKILARREYRLDAEKTLFEQSYELSLNGRSIARGLSIDQVMDRLFALENRAILIEAEEWNRENLNLFARAHIQPRIFSPPLTLLNLTSKGRGETTQWTKSIPEMIGDTADER